MSLFDDAREEGDGSSVRLDDLTAADVDHAIQRRAAIGLAVGSVEQHGPHLPLGTDLRIPCALLYQLCRVLDCLVAPPIPYGCRSMPQTGAGEFFGGNLSVDGSVLGPFVEAVVAQLIRIGFTRIFLLSWHWENMRVVWEAGMRAYEAGHQEETKIVVIDNPGLFVSALTTERVFGPGFAGWELEHASIAETSLMEWFFPQLVRTSLMVDDRPGETVRFEVIPAAKGRAPASGVFGPATQASAEKGELLARDLIDGIGAVLEKELAVDRKRRIRVDDLLPK